MLASSEAVLLPRGGCQTCSKSNAWPESSDRSPLHTPRPSGLRTIRTNRPIPRGRRFRSVRAGAAMAARTAAGCRLLHLQRPRTSFFFDHYSAFALGIGNRIRRPTKAAGRAPCRRCADIRNWPRTSAPHWSPTSSICRSSRTSRSITARSRRSPCCGRTSRVAGADRPAAGRRDPVSDSVGEALLEARRGAYAGRSRAIPRICASSSFRPAGFRTRCTANAPASTTRPGTNAFSNCWKRIRRRWPR